MTNRTDAPKPCSTADAQPAGRELALLRAARDLFMSNRITPEQIEAVRVAVNAYAEPLRTSDAPHVTVSAAEYDEIKLTLARQSAELHDLRSRNDAPRAESPRMYACPHRALAPCDECSAASSRPDATREESRLDELLTEVADLVRYWKAYGDDDPGVLSRVADVARAFKDLPPSSRDKASGSIGAVVAWLRTLNGPHDPRALADEIEKTSDTGDGGARSPAAPVPNPLPARASEEAGTSRIAFVPLGFEAIKSRYLPASSPETAKRVRDYMPKVDDEVVHSLGVAHGVYGRGIIVGVPWPDWARVEWSNGAETFEHADFLHLLASGGERANRDEP